MHGFVDLVVRPPVEGRRDVEPRVSGLQGVHLLNRAFFDLFPLIAWKTRETFLQQMDVETGNGK
jgi:hypothetical protein